VPCCRVRWQLVRALLPRLFLLSGGSASVGVRHAGDTPSRGFYGRKTPPLRGGVVWWIVGVVLNVQSTSAGCAEKGVFGAKWTTF